ncbi:quinolinate synthase NadA [Methylocystis sp. WRRC1]|uniref:quinolinate synthase NadA n=1 Tax=Methylocystis sp. WRRC1 TaxID=1732014 RepID=UPI001D13AA60|nr:quinolinate synthase NadA [Methylocystis sp. WRRC1]MCC3243850.1 quinolinate synthase NadA [Methylocystis sp. WRRC1]
MALAPTPPAALGVGPNGRFPVLPRPDLQWTPEVEAATAHLYERVSRVIPPVEWPFFAPYVKAINDIKKTRNAVILAHNYMTPEIYHCVSDYIGDSLQLAKLAAKSEADVIVQGGVYFMAETSKILNPDKVVLIPDADAGCSLAASITGADVRALRAKYPGVPIVAYVNTSAEVKAEVDICCTSSNAVKVVESLGVDRVIMVPDRFLAQNVAAQTKVKIIAWEGACEVHERFTAEEIQNYKADHPGLKVIAHPECPREVVEVSDFSGSTAAMIDYVRTKHPARVLLVTECSMADNIAAETVGTQFIRPCNFCPHMKRITLPKILDSLLYIREEVTVDPAIAERARRSVQRMIDLG